MYRADVVLNKSIVIHIKTCNFIAHMVTNMSIVLSLHTTYDVYARILAAFDESTRRHSDLQMYIAHRSFLGNMTHQ
jgi:hypothetical protein